jgi:hypothetical protein
MKRTKSIPVFVLLLLIVACKNNLDVNKQSLELKDSSSLPVVAETSINDIPSSDWLDDSIANYIRFSQMDLIVLDRKNNDQISWMIDKQDRNERVYYAIKIGRDFEDRFVSDGWIFIDSASRQIYEYDLAEDSLIEFKPR